MEEYSREYRHGYLVMNDSADLDIVAIICYNTTVLSHNYEK